jgi:hypothetical protein
MGVLEDVFGVRDRVALVTGGAYAIAKAGVINLVKQAAHDLARSAGWVTLLRSAAWRCCWRRTRPAS